MVTLRTPHAKNQPPRPKTVAYRRITDRQTDTQTHRQRKQTLRTPFSIFFSCFRFSFEGAVRLNLKFSVIDSKGYCCNLVELLLC